MHGSHLHNHQLNSQGDSGDRLYADSLPLIDTRLLSQSELLSLSRCSPLYFSSSSSASLAVSSGRYDDSTPKVDRSVFNESAGSRKQTFLRLRLARHPPLPRPPSPQRQFDETSLEENSQVASLLRSLFSTGSSPTKRKEVREGDEEIESEGQRLFPVPINFYSNVYQNLNLDSVQSVVVQVISGNETGRKRGRPRKILNPSDHTFDISVSEGTEAFDLSPRDEGIPYSMALEALDTPLEKKPCMDLGLERIDEASALLENSNSNTTNISQEKKKRGRPPKNRYSLDQVTVDWKLEDNEPLNLQNREGSIIDSLALANVEDPYGEELRRRTMGLQSKTELLGFLAELRGEWVNVGKKKKVVDASEFGSTLPQGWKLMLCLKTKAGKSQLACRRYISPNGQKQFESCKEVSMYLCSILEAQGNKNQLNTDTISNTVVELSNMAD